MQTRVLSKTMTSSVLMFADNLYKSHVGAILFSVGAGFGPFPILQAIKHTVRAVRTDRPGRPYSVISFSEIGGQGKARAVVFKTYRRIGDTTIEKVAQVGLFNCL